MRKEEQKMGFPSSLAGKESTCNAGDFSSIPGLGRSPGEGIGYPHQYSWASLLAQMVKNLPAMRETWARSLGWEDPLEQGKATHSSILAWRIPMDREAWWAPVPGIEESDTTEPLSALSSGLEYTQSILRLVGWDRDADSEEKSEKGQIPQAMGRLHGKVNTSKVSVRVLKTCFEGFSL